LFGHRGHRGHRRLSRRNDTHGSTNISRWKQLMSHSSHENKGPGPAVNGDEVRNVKFGSGTYDSSQVDDLLERIAAELDAGRPAGPLIANATFQQRLLRRRGYDSDAVDWFLDQLRRREDPSEAACTTADPWRDLAAEPYYIRREPGDPAGRITEPSPQEYADAWRDFGQQPGARLSWVRTGTMRRELRTADQQTVVSFRYAAIAANWPSPTSIVGNHRLSAGGRTFTLKRVTVSAWPGIARTISRDRLGTDRNLHHQTDDRDPFLRQLLDETRIAVLYRGGKHIERNAGSYIKFPGHRWLRFPVRGTKRANAIMTAVDQAGNKVARYRFAGSRKTIEIAVHPDHRLTEELALTIAVSAPWIGDYFSREGGGG
jgi:DivIVA domain-containing protein